MYKMAIKLTERYPGKTAGVSADYPLGQARNITTPGDGTGTPLDAALVNDDQGFKQALLAAAGIVATGNPDTAVASQYLQALQKLINDAATAVSAKQIGVGQTWQDVKSSRANGATYTNNTGRPIQILVAFRDTYNTGLSVTVGGVTLFSLDYDVQFGGFYPVSFIVPIGATYQVSWAASPGNTELVSWVELR